MTTNRHTNAEKKRLLNLINPLDVSLEVKDPVDPKALEQASAIISELHPEGTSVCNPEKLVEVAKRLGDMSAESDSYVISSEACKEAFDALPPEDRQALRNIHDRVKTFATAQRSSVTDVTIPIPGGRAGHKVMPCKAAGCYAPGGRYPLPSSVVMTVVTARAAGCQIVVLASPKPAKITMAAAYVSGADIVLGIGGAQAVAAMAYGVPASSLASVEIPRCDVIVGPGNQWVTAAKSLVSGRCGIDMLAGPSEVLVIADDAANADVVASDLIAQAEHDVVARAILLSDSIVFIDKVDAAVRKQLETLPEPNQSIARAALTQSFAVHCQTLDQCVEISDAISPEHLEIQTHNSREVASKCCHYGGLFIGANAAEVLGDYGAGPNHTLPTGGTGRYTGGLSVFHFLAMRTWMEIDNDEGSRNMVEDSIRMARLEGLEGHARAAEMRRKK